MIFEGELIFEPKHGPLLELSGGAARRGLK